VTIAALIISIAALLVAVIAAAAGDVRSRWIQLEADPAGWILCAICGDATRARTRLGAAGTNAGGA
jgi:hypothetical protein